MDEKSDERGARQAGALVMAADLDDALHCNDEQAIGRLLKALRSLEPALWRDAAVRHAFWLLLVLSLRRLKERAEAGDVEAGTELMRVLERHPALMSAIALPPPPGCPAPWRIQADAQRLRAAATALAHRSAEVARKSVEAYARAQALSREARELRVRARRVALPGTTRVG
jgi:hypothetical protein